MLTGNPVRQAHVRPYPSPFISGDWSITVPYNALDGSHSTPHNGLDFGNGHCGGDVLAVVRMKIIVAGTPAWSLGSHVVRGQSTADPTWRFDVHHLLDDVVSVGQIVEEGGLVGHCGSTGQSTACHVHEAALKKLASGAWVHRDPWPLLKQNNVAVNGEGARFRTASRVSSAIFATSEDDGIIRADGRVLGPLTMPMFVQATVIDGPYVIDGIPGNAWLKVKLDGASRYIAKPLAHYLG
jgi:hypothetical protein